MVRALRPVWWVARGWGLYVVVVSQVLREFVPAQWVPRTPLAWLICAITVGLSIQYGRKKFWQGRWGCRAGRLVSVVGLIAALIAVNSMVNYIHWRTSAANYAAGDADAAYWRGMEARSDGVFINGESATNLFVYDAEGQPVEGARVVDQEGRWVVLANPQGTRWNYVEPDYVSWYGESVPTFVTDDSEAPNVYPYTYEWYKPYSTGDYPEYDEEGNIILPNPSGVMEPAWPQATLAPLADSGREAEPGVEGEAGNADPEPQTGAAEAPSGGDASPAPEASSDPAPEPSPEPSEAE